MKRFFQTASAMPWYKNTLFVITADHTSSNIQYAENRTGWGLFAIPIIFFKPDNSLAGMENEIAQQVDIMPSVLGYLHYQKPYFAFGRDVFHGNEKPIAFNYKDDTYQLFMDDYLLVFDGERTRGLYNFQMDKLMKKNLMSDKPEIVKIMEAKVKALIQQYNNRMVDDSLTVERGIP
jgi:arylsulfatase A-like enzyme